MKSITLKLDLYSKIVLTVIAISLVGLLLRGFNINQEAKAGYGDTVYIANPEDIGRAVANRIDGLNVNVTNAVDVNVTDPIDVNVTDAEIIQPVHVADKV